MPCGRHKKRVAPPLPLRDLDKVTAVPPARYVEFHFFSLQIQEPSGRYRSLTAVEVEQQSGLSAQTIHRLREGKAVISAYVAIGLERWTGVPARNWLMLQAEWDLHQEHRRKDGNV